MSSYDFFRTTWYFNLEDDKPTLDDLVYQLNYSSTRAVYKTDWAAGIYRIYTHGELHGRVGDTIKISYEQLKGFGTLEPERWTGLYVRSSNPNPPNYTVVIHRVWDTNPYDPNDWGQIQTLQATSGLPGAGLSIGLLVNEIGCYRSNWVTAFSYV